MTKGNEKSPNVEKVNETITKLVLFPRGEQGLQMTQNLLKFSQYKILKIKVRQNRVWSPTSENNAAHKQAHAVQTLAHGIHTSQMYSPHACTLHAFRRNTHSYWLTEEWQVLCMNMTPTALISHLCFKTQVFKMQPPTSKTSYLSSRPTPAADSIFPPKRKITQNKCTHKRLITDLNPRHMTTMSHAAGGGGFKRTQSSDGERGQVLADIWATSL